LRIRVLYFASFRDITNKNEELYDLPNNTPVASLIREAISRYPGLSDERIFTAVNGMSVDSSALLHDGDSVAIFPIVSGG